MVRWKILIYLPLKVTDAPSAKKKKKKNNNNNRLMSHTSFALRMTPISRMALVAVLPLLLLLVLLLLASLAVRPMMTSFSPRLVPWTGPRQSESLNPHDDPYLPA